MATSVYACMCVYSAWHLHDLIEDTLSKMEESNERETDLKTWRRRPEELWIQG